jgi:hypothetical protein
LVGHVRRSDEHQQMARRQWTRAQRRRIASQTADSREVEIQRLAGKRREDRIRAA